MPVELKCYRVFIASPGGLQAEREAFREAVEDYNRSDARDRGVLFWAVGWEDTPGRIGRPQSIINEDIADCDYFVLVLWDRWGTPPGPTGDDKEFESGTEEEYNLAMQCLRNPEAPMRDVVLLFKAPDSRQLADPGEQLSKVLAFRKQIEAERSHLYSTFDNVDTFISLVRRHLARWLRTHEEGPSSKAEIGSYDSSSTSGHLQAATGGSDGFRIFGEDQDAISEAWSLANQGRIIEAETFLAKAAVGGDPGALNAYGLFLHRQGRTDRAEAMFERALRGWETTGFSEGRSSSLQLLAKIHADKGNLKEAEDLVRQALKIEHDEGRIHNTVAPYGTLGSVLWHQGDLAGAEAMYRVALETNEARKKPRPIWEGSLYGSLGGVMLAGGKVDAAREMFEKSVEVLAQIEPSDDDFFGLRENLSLSYRQLGSILLSEGCSETAAEMFRHAVEIEEYLNRGRELAESLRGLGFALKKAGDIQAAERAFKDALSAAEDYGDPTDIAKSLRAVGEAALAREEFDDAESAYRRLLAMSYRNRYGRGLYWAYNGLGDVFEAQGDQEEAEQMREAVRALTDDSTGQRSADVGLAQEIQGDTMAE